MVDGVHKIFTTPYIVFFLLAELFGNRSVRASGIEQSLPLPGQESRLPPLCAF